MSILIKDALLDGECRNIRVEGNRIASIDSKEGADTVIDGKGKAVIPGLVNTHTGPPGDVRTRASGGVRSRLSAISLTG